MEEFVKFLVSSLVQNKEDIKISQTQTNDEVCLVIKVNEQDFGRVIGKNGKNAQAIRTLVNSLAKQHEDNKKYIIKFE